MNRHETTRTFLTMCGLLAAILTLVGLLTLGAYGASNLDSWPVATIGFGGAFLWAAGLLTWVATR